MKPQLSRILGLASIAALCAAALVAAAPAPQPAAQFTGNLVDTLSTVRHNKTFILSVDRYTNDDELQRLAGILAGAGPYSARDELWKMNSGTISFGGGLGYPVAAVIERDTPAGRSLRVVINRPLSLFETQYYTRSSRYPFTVLELDLDSSGHGEGRLIAAAKMKVDGSTVSFESLGPQPLRLLDVRQD